MQIIFFSSNIDMIKEWKQRHTVEISQSCYDLESLKDEISNIDDDYILVCDYDSIAHDLNTLISSNSLPKHCVVLEKSPAITTGKMLISKGVKAYGNSRMLNIHYLQLIETLRNGNIWTYPELTSALIDVTKENKLNDNACELINSRLTNKELGVVLLILDGLTNNAISDELGITTRTVKAHVSSIFSKLHVNDRISLVLLLK